jgi:hypothetical protein
MVKEEQPALHEELEKLRIEIVDQGQVNVMQVTMTWRNESVQPRSRVQKSKFCEN